MEQCSAMFLDMWTIEAVMENIRAVDPSRGAEENSHACRCLQGPPAGGSGLAADHKWGHSSWTGSSRACSSWTGSSRGHSSWTGSRMTHSLKSSNRVCNSWTGSSHRSHSPPWSSHRSHSPPWSSHTSHSPPWNPHRSHSWSRNRLAHSSTRACSSTRAHSSPHSRSHSPHSWSRSPHSWSRSPHSRSHSPHSRSHSPRNSHSSSWFWWVEGGSAQLRPRAPRTPFRSCGRTRLQADSGDGTGSLCFQLPTSRHTQCRHSGTTSCTNQ
ncbi:arginine/serine-rich protein 1-like [Mustela putorius furo]|uniref:Arginine/serine-rich protein 1-like n=1 Tax=Mustela putorius furo TaxID=9669 RepID=A0A8U0VB95_MUSPF|nr:arginine/serine-rich protein 1-like [Mustela putorius furo]